MAIRPIGDRVLAKAVKEIKKAEEFGLLSAPNSKEDKPFQFEVVALGTGGFNEYGDDIPFSVEIGDMILINRYAGSDTQFEGVKYKIVPCGDIMAVVE